MISCCGNDKLSAACTRVRAQQAWLLPVGETGGEHVAAAHASPTQQAQVLSNKRHTVLPAATLALSDWWCHTGRLAVTFPVQRLGCRPNDFTESTAHGRITFAVLICTHSLSCSTTHCTRIDGLLPSFVWHLCPGLIAGWCVCFILLDGVAAHA